jgi:hypothetical protein
MFSTAPILIRCITAVHNTQEQFEFVAEMELMHKTDIGAPLTKINKCMECTVLLYGVYRCCCTERTAAVWNWYRTWCAITAPRGRDAVEFVAALELMHTTNVGAVLLILTIRTVTV